jgi:hypothetical protein
MSKNSLFHAEQGFQHTLLNRNDKKGLIGVKTGVEQGELQNFFSVKLESAGSSWRTFVLVQWISD